MPRQNNLPPAGPGKSLRQQLQEIANANTVEAARRGFAEIDRHAERGKRKLKEIGINGADELVDSATTLVKRLAAELMTGRPQQ